MTTTPHIVVLGAGYTGLTAAKLIAARTAATVTLVNERDRFVERMRNHQVASGQRLRDLPLRDLLKGTGVQLLVDRVTRVDAERGQVELAGAEPLGYDLLVNALGSQADLDTVPGVAEHADSVAGIEQAQRLHERMHTADTVAVVGGRLTGLEVATELAETYPDRTVRLVTSGALGEGLLSERGLDHLHRVLDRLGVQVLEHATVAKVAADGLLLENGEHVGADAVAWTTGFQASPLAREAGIAVGGGGRMLVDATMRSLSHPDVYGVGDAAAACKQDGQVLRMGCGPGGIATVAGAHAVIDRLAGRTPAPLRFRYVGLCISLGRRDGLIQMTDADELPRDKVVTGRLAAAIKERIVSGATYGQRRPILSELAAKAF